MRSVILCLMTLVLTTAANCVSAQGRLPPCPGSFNAATWTNCFGESAFPGGAKYVGEFKDGKPNGQGGFTFPDGENYVGEFRNSAPNGQGTHTLPSGEKYVGEFRNGKANGQGIEYRADGSVLRSGTFENDIFVRGQ